MKGVLQELSQPPLDRLGFVLGTDETQERVIRIPDVAEASVVGVVRVMGGNPSQLLSDGDRFRCPPGLASTSCLTSFPVVDGVDSSLGAAGELRKECLLD